MTQYICLHGHFYQPPRENPWLGIVESQESAFPHHDWNSRITAECYVPNSAARILEKNRFIVDIVNNYAKISFDFGPTLLSWLERNAADVYQAILEADLRSRGRYSGHGSALALPYNHVILPLANMRDKKTQIVWGIEDFAHRFRRQPEGMWLPETAVDTGSLEILADRGIRFTILAPHQARRFRRIGRGDWQSVAGKGLDTNQPYVCRLPSGKSIALFFYDQALSHELSFGDLLKDGEGFTRRLFGVLEGKQEGSGVLSLASDGEIYGHHHLFGDMALAYCLARIEKEKSFSLTNCAEYLERFPPENEVEIAENSSWSCPHGVERWRKDCGCRTGPHPGWTQEWRVPLREAMDGLRDRLAIIFEREMEGFLQDPWQARDAYISVLLDRSRQNVEAFFSNNTVRELSSEEKSRALKWLEVQRNAMLMFTSCGWFFEDISGIETVQNLRYAARAMQLAGKEGGEDLEPEFVRKLEKAPCNAPEYRNGAEIYEREISPAVMDLSRIGASYTTASLFKDYPDALDRGLYSFQRELNEILIRGRDRLSLGDISLTSNITWEKMHLFYAALLFEGNNLLTGVARIIDEKTILTKSASIKRVFETGDIPATIRTLEDFFHEHLYRLQHLFKDEKKEVLSEMMALAQKEAEASFQHIYEKFYPWIQGQQQNRAPLSKTVHAAFEFALNTDFCRLLERENLEGDVIEKLVEKFQRWSIRPDGERLCPLAGGKIELTLKKLCLEPFELKLWSLLDTLYRAVESLSLDVDLWKSQNLFFRLCQNIRANRHDWDFLPEQEAKKWKELVERFGKILKVKCL